MSNSFFSSTPLDTASKTLNQIASPGLANMTGDQLTRMQEQMKLLETKGEAASSGGPSRRKTTQAEDIRTRISKKEAEAAGITETQLAKLEDVLNKSEKSSAKRTEMRTGAKAKATANANANATVSQGMARQSQAMR